MRLYLFVCTVLPFLCAASISVHAQSRPKTECPELKVKAEITHTRDGDANGEIVLKFEDGDEASNYYIFLRCKECKSGTKPEDSPEFQNLKRGHYDIYIIAKNGCSKQLNLQVR